MKILVKTTEHRPIRNGQYASALKDKRLGVMLHYDGSVSDYGGMNWFRSSDCKVSYHFLVLDDGSYVPIAPIGSAAWHAGNCTPSNSTLHYHHANSAFYGIAAATNSTTPVTQKQLLTISALTRMVFDLNKWDLRQTWRITGHADEAWPRGRRIDPYGFETRSPILNIKSVKELLPVVSFEGT